MTTGARWVKMTPDQYREYKENGSQAVVNAFGDGYKAGYEQGYKDSQYFFRSYTPDEAEVENDENWNC